MLDPEWPAPARVRALVTTRSFGDMAREEGRRKLREHLPAAPRWLRQVHGKAVVCLDDPGAPEVGDAAVTRCANTPCVVTAADCMPVFFANEQASMVGVAHAGWRGLAAGVLEATVDEMGAPDALMAWLGPAIGPRVYEVGEEVRAALAPDEQAFTATRPGHFLLDLYALGRQRLERKGVRRIYGGGWCTYGDAARFFSYRRDRAAERMAAAIWLT